MGMFDLSQSSHWEHTKPPRTEVAAVNLVRSASESYLGADPSPKEVLINS